MPFLRSLLGLCSITSVIAGAYSMPTVATDVFEQLPMVPAGWTLVGRPKPSDLIRFSIALKSPNLEQLENAVIDMSTPGHRSYGQHMKRDELKAMVRPSDAATDAVLAWLEAAGIPSQRVEDDDEWINFVASVRQAESMLDTIFYWFRNNQNQVEQIRTLQYSLPPSLHQWVNMIQPTTRFGQMRPERSTVHDVKVLDDAWSELRVAGDARTLNTTNCGSAMTPACLREIYDIKGFTPDPRSGSQLGIAGYLEQYAQYADLAQFLERYVPEQRGANFSVTAINRGLNTQNDPTKDSTEANLDIQYGLGLSYPVPATYYTTPGRGPLVPDLLQPNQSRNTNEPYLDFLTYILRLPDSLLPRTLSTSYGEEEQSLPPSYKRTVCTMFMLLGARGVSVLFASGDSGPGAICFSNDGRNLTHFQPIFPATCPWVTAVGGTYGVQPERAIQFSSGGFSDTFGRPGYQRDVVDSYLETIGDTFSGLYTPGGRAFPDVAAQALNYRIVDKGRDILVSGTSAASPTFAAIIALLNAARLSAGKSPLGFLNPWLYSTAKDGLTDIVDGGSRGCEARNVEGVVVPAVPGAGWNATQGWDPVTGLGTPVFSKLLKLI